MDDFDIPIFKKVYDLYKSLHQIRNSIPKQDRHTIWQRCEDAALDVIEHILHASALPRNEKIDSLNQASTKLNLLRLLIRLSHDTRVIDTKKYTNLQKNISETGRMLGGWIRSLKE